MEECVRFSVRPCLRHCIAVPQYDSKIPGCLHGWQVHCSFDHPKVPSGCSTQRLFVAAGPSSCVILDREELILLAYFVLGRRNQTSVPTSPLLWQLAAIIWVSASPFFFLFLFSKKIRFPVISFLVSQNYHIGYFNRNLRDMIKVTINLKKVDDQDPHKEEEEEEKAYRLNWKCKSTALISGKSG